MRHNGPDVQFKKLDTAVDLSGVGEIPQLNRDSIHPDLDDLEALVRSDYTVEWGTRSSDGALVIHFFPKVDGDNVATEWDEAYKMDKRLEHALPLSFNINKLSAGFEKDYNSFYVIVAGLLSLDLRLLVQGFLEKIEGAPIH